ncbi:MAG: sulfatase-like hydrolase/transferase, partial [Verrucomicrobia bacterium]|nr:sulfatase-like hydrolase/transferase [Verrucomicrobiota bacterium]
LPNHLGFDEYFCGTMRRYHASHGLDGRPFKDAPHVVADDRFRVEVQTEAALSFLDRRAKIPSQPWFLYLAWFAPHVPLESPEPWFSQTPKNLPKERRQALAMIAAMDDGLGKIRAKLREMNAEKNTLIFFISDNGAPLKPGAWDGSLNAPLIGEKGMLTDGGTRTPFVAAWPGAIPAGQTYEHPVINLDVTATSVALAGLPHDKKLDGVNLMPFLTGANKAAPHDYLFWRWRSQAAVLEFPWKLIVLGDHEKFLFNVTNPEGELAANNLLAQHPDVVARLENKLKAWSATLNPPGVPEPKNTEDDKFFADHVTKTISPEPKAGGTNVSMPATADESTGTQGWLGRNCSLQTKNGVLAISQEASSKGPAVITRNALDLPGPVTLTVRIRTSAGGKGAVSWRVKSDADFPPGQTTTFDWPASPEWHDVKIEMPVSGRLIHLRINLPRPSPETQIQSITLEARDGTTRTFHFDKQK